MGSITVFGSVNLDLTVVLSRLPRPGETVTGGRLERHHGGKGGNQAVAAVRAGGHVRFVGAVGDDEDGADLVARLADEGIDTTHVARVAGVASGTALISVDEQGENQIAVAPGANRHARADPTTVDGAAVVLAQLEAPVDAVAAFLAAGRARGATAVLNAAPLVDGAADVAGATDIVVVNADERAALGRIDGVTVITTLGPEGVIVADPDGFETAFDGHAVAPVDTVGAGDAVCGALVAGLAEGRPLLDAVRRANAAGALATTRPGARSAPTTAELDAFLELVAGGPGR